jgi:hypothetical protein
LHIRRIKNGWIECGKQEPGVAIGMTRQRDRQD